MSKSIDKWQTLGFKRKPFIDLSRTKAFFTPKQQQQLTLLEELVREGGHLLLLLGVSGVGKTTFLNTFKKNIALPSQQVVIGLCEMQGDATVNITMIKGLLAKHLTVADGIDSDTFMQSLKARLTQLTQSNERFLLIIDDAHQLPIETVRFILDFMSELDETAQSLSILLAGRMQLEHLFASPITSDWTTGSSFTIVLEPLNEEEVADYIKHGLRQAGYKGVMPFSKSQLMELSINSKGILARLLVMAVDSLETKSRNTTQAHSWAISPKMIGTAIALLALVGVGMIWNDISAPVPAVIADDNTKVVTVEKQGAWVKTITKPVDVAANDIAPKITVIDATPVAMEQTATDAPVTNEITPAVTDAPVTKDVTPAATDAPVTKDVTPAATVLPAANIKAVSAVPVATKAVANNTPPAKSNTKVVVAPKDMAINTPIANDGEVLAKPKPKTKISPPPPKTVFKTQGYTVQIAGGTDLKSLQRTVCQLWTAKAGANCSSALPNNLHYIRTVKDSKDWYIATIGQYTSSAEASQQLRQLPASVQKNMPWARAFAQIPNATVVE